VLSGAVCRAAMLHSLIRAKGAARWMNSSRGRVSECDEGVNTIKAIEASVTSCQFEDLRQRRFSDVM
jgi:hypothetical protein